jgi:ferredoxin
MSLIPGLGIAKGMALTLRRFFEPKATIRYPEQPADVPPKFRGRLQLLYDEYGTLKCETCFQCAQACPIECIDMGGVDTKDRFHIHWGAPEQYAERRAAFRSLRYETVQGAGHMLHHDQPEAVARLIEEFLLS